MKYIAYDNDINKIQMQKMYPNAKVYDKAELIGFGLEFRGKISGGHLTIIKKKNSKVPVLIWDIKEEESFDKYKKEFDDYIKGEIEIETKKNGKIKGIIYIMREGYDIQCPLGEYYRICWEGYKQLGLNEHPLYIALQMAIDEKIKNVMLI